MRNLDASTTRPACCQSLFVCIAARTSNDDIKSRRYAKVESFNGDFISGCAGVCY